MVVQSDEMAAVPSPVNLLWTGGWDSTFRLLQLLLEQQREVVPYYLRDASRASTQAELQAMQRIRQVLQDKHPHSQQLLHPLRLSDIATLAPDPAITDAFHRLVREQFIGSQYQWLAKFHKQLGIAELELAAGYRGGRINRIVAPLMTQTEQHGHTHYRLDPIHAQRKEFLIFGGFSFPLLQLDKRQTAEIAAERGWLDILQMSWFCHKPAGDQPCGTCNPCLYAVDEGFGWRIPRRNRIKGAFYRALVKPMKAPAKALLQQWRPASVQR